ncbi:MAG: GntR family transcriptional regulator [Proteobacteria bacterium]|nr:GntR family transcriptional regulator [Pseudomonadota bacterium]
MDKAYEAVRGGIIDGRFPPATRITEQEVAAAAGVSRTPAREALRRLHAEGLVEFTPNLGAVVSEWTDAEFDEIFDLRALLESHGVARAALRISDADVEALRALATQQLGEARERREGHLDRIADLNRRFHRRLQEAAGSPRLMRALAALLEAPLIMKTFLNYSPEDLQRSAAHHLELVQALAARDPEWAASVMRSHILAAKRTLGREPRRPRPG